MPVIDGVEYSYCEKCGGTGYQDGKRKPGAWCRCKEIIEAATDQQVIRKRARVPMRYGRFLWDDFKIVPGPSVKELAETVGKVTSYRDRIVKLEQSGIGLYLYGSCSTGKTMLACLLAMEMQRKGIDAVFYTASEALTWFRKEWFGKGQGNADMGLDDEGPYLPASNPMECAALVLDDCFDKENTYLSAGGMQVAQLDELLRHHIHRNHPVILTGNVNLKYVEENVSEKLAALLRRHVYPTEIKSDYIDMSERTIREAVLGGR